MRDKIEQEKKHARNVMIAGIAQILANLKIFILIPIITKNLGEEPYGIWIQFSVLLMLMGLIFTLGLPFALVRFLPGEKTKERARDRTISALAIVTMIILPISLILYFLSNITGEILFQGEGELMAIMAFVLPFYSINMLLIGHFRGLQRMDRYSFFLVFNAFLEISVVGAIIYTGHDIKTALYSFIIVNAISSMLMLAVFFRDMGMSRPKTSKGRDMIRFGIPTLPSNLSSWIIDSSDKYLIGFYLGALFIGYYSPAYTLGAMLWYLAMPLGVMMPAILSELYDKGRRKQVKRYLGLSMKYYLALAIPSLVGIVMLSEQFLTVISTEEIASRSFIVVLLVGVALLISGIRMFYAQILYLVKKTKVIGMIWTVCAAVNFGLNILLIPKYGLAGAAATTLLAYGIAFGAIYANSRKYIRFKLEKYSAAKMTISAGAMGGIIYLLPVPSGIIQLILVVLLSVGIYFSLLLSLKGIKKEEVDFFLRKVWKK